MKTKPGILLVSYFAIYLFTVSALHGQTDQKNIPYNIEIKKNFENIKAVNLSAIGKELSFIPLETTPDCLIQEIEKILFSDSYIFVSEIKRLLQFDKNGKFIRQIGSEGRGPEEYFSVGDFSIDEQRKEIYIISIASARLFIYGFDGAFKNSFNLSFRPAQIIPKDNNSLMFHLWNAPGNNDPSWIITNRQGINTASIKNNLKRISKPGLIIKDTPLYLFDNTVHFMEFGIDTLYYFKDTMKKPYAVFSLGDLKIETDQLFTESMVKSKEFLIDKLWIVSIIENNEFLFIEFSRGITGSSMCAIYNKKNDAVNFLKDDTFQNDLGGGIGFWPKQIINDNMLVDYVDAFDLLKRIIPSSLRSKLTETSNPVLMIVR
jgi:hypothetical protein